MDYLKNFLNNRYFLFIVYSLVAAYILALCIKEPGIDGYAPAKVIDMIYGKAERPYVSRALVPFFVKSIAVITPESVKSGIREALNSKFPADRFFAKFRFQPEYIYEYLWVMAIMLSCLIGFMYVYRKMLIEVFSAGSIFYNYAPILTLLALPLVVRYYVYLNDFPNLFLFALMLYSMMKLNWKLYIPAFTLACLNKETAIIIIVAYIFYFYKNTALLPKNRFYILGLVQFGIYIIIKGAMSLIFRNNGGPFMEFHLFDHNLAIFFHPYLIDEFVSLLVLVLLVIHNWKEKPEFFRKALVMFWPLLILGIFWGYLDELRAYYYELFSILALLITQSIFMIYGKPLSVRKL